MENIMATIEPNILLSKYLQKTKDNTIVEIFIQIKLAAEKYKYFCFNNNIQNKKIIFVKGLCTTKPNFSSNHLRLITQVIAALIIIFLRIQG